MPLLKPCMRRLLVSSSMWRHFLLTNPLVLLQPLMQRLLESSRIWRQFPWTQPWLLLKPSTPRLLELLSTWRQFPWMDTLLLPKPTRLGWSFSLPRCCAASFVTVHNSSLSKKTVLQPCSRSRFTSYVVENIILVPTDVRGISDHYDDTYNSRYPVNGHSSDLPSNDVAHNVRCAAHFPRGSSLPWYNKKVAVLKAESCVIGERPRHRSRNFSREFRLWTSCDRPFRYSTLSGGACHRPDVRVPRLIWHFLQFAVKYSTPRPANIRCRRKRRRALGDQLRDPKEIGNKDSNRAPRNRCETCQNG